MNRPGVFTRSSSTLGVDGCKPSPMRVLRNDGRAFEEFKARATRTAIGGAPEDMTVEMKAENGVNEDRLPMHIFEWELNDPNSPGAEIGNLTNVSQLDSSAPQVRVIFAPLDIPATETASGLITLFRKFDIPSAFVDEGLQNVSQSFGCQKNESAEYVWFHLLSKDLAISIDNGPLRIVHQLGTGRVEEHCSQVDEDCSYQLDELANIQDKKLSQENFTWMKPGFVLKIEDDNEPFRSQSHSPTDSYKSVATSTGKAKAVTLLCFGAPISFLERFRRLKENATCEHLLHDPYVLLEVVFEEMHKLMDRVGWHVADVFGNIETETLRTASTPGKIHRKQINFAGLHNLLKHTIYLRENCESALCTLNSLHAERKESFGGSPTPWQQSTQKALEYRQTLFQSTQRRLSSLHQRMENILQLSFHLVTQKDSRVMQSEALSMKMIAVMTLIFMPLGTVASIFGSQLIKLKDEEPYHMQVSQDFWLVWLIAVPLTVLVVVIWRVWYHDARAQLIDKIPPREEGDHGYFGWKSFKESFRGPKRRHKDAVHIV